MEHDAYLLDADDFEKAYEFMLEHDIAYATLGLFMSCYSNNKHSATWMYEQLIRENNVPVNCGPYLMAEKLYKLYAKHFLSKRNYLGKEYSFMIPFVTLINLDTEGLRKKCFRQSILPERLGEQCPLI